MIQDLRRAYNAAFTEQRYQAFLDWVAAQHNFRPTFRIAETPVFVDRALKKKLLTACEEITDVIVRSDFRELSRDAVLHGQVVPNETPHTAFLQMDFGICKDENGELTPQLIEVQGFPSLYFFQEMIARGYRRHFDIPTDLSPLFNNLTPETYYEKLKKVILGDARPENVVLLEIEPDKQATAIDFIVCKAVLGIEPCCVSDLIVEGREVYYEKNGRKIGVERIFNRVIFDELMHRTDLKRSFYFSQEHDVQWAGHPHWFFRISKHTLPLLKSRYVPESYFLKDLDTYPDDLHNWVLKPLYSFAGTGVIINLSHYDLESIEDPENYILQRKVTYAPVVETPNEPAKCELRMLMLWEPDEPRPVMVNNLARLSKGQMIGTRYNKDRDWVGASVGFFEPG